MNINLSDYLSGYLKAAHLGGESHLCTIEHVESREFDDNGKKKEKVVVTLREFTQPWVLNQTNLNMFMKLFGSNSEDAIGKQIEVYPDVTQYGPKMVDCIRCRKVRLQDRTGIHTGLVKEEVPF
jgi:hypothetical protein